MTIALAQSALDLDALVVTGTPGATEKRAVGTAISTIDAGSVTDVAPIRDVSQLITGRAAGALVRNASGAIGGGSRITLRGSATLGLNDQPLIYVDGIRVDNTQGAGLPNEGAGTPNAPISRLNDFSPEQIESIEIIKGPAASTLYGTEAANGVIQIITKKGARDGGTTWDVTVEQGATWFQSPADRFNLIYGRDAGGQVLTINPVELAERQGEDPFRTGHLQRYALSLSGGADRFQYFVGGELNRDRGTDPTQALDQYRGRFNFTVAPTDELRLNTNIGYLKGRTQTPNDGNFGGPIWAFHNIRPSLLETPRRGWLFGSPTEWYRGWDFYQDVSRTTLGLQVEHRPTGWFTQRLNLGADLLREDSHQVAERMSDDLLLAFGSSLGRGYATYLTRDATNSTIDYAASADLPLGRRWRAKTSAGVQYYHKSQAAVDGSGTGFPAAGLRTLSAAAIRDVGESFIENNTVGLFVQEELALNERLYVTGAVRADDNSAFGKNFDMVYYPKASLTWVVSEEPFWGLDAFSTLRLRGAFGMSGQQPDVFDALRTFTPVSGAGGVPAVTPTNIGNPDLEPEKSREIEIGFDAGLLDERLAIELTYYDQRTEDAIVARNLPPSGGFGGVQFVNLGELSNAGLELLVNARVLERTDLALDLMLNLATNDSEIVDVGNSTGFISLSGAQRHQEGYPVAAFFSRHVVSARLENGRPVDILCDDGSGGTMPCAAAPEVYLGRSLPTTFGAVSPALTLFQRLRLHALVDFQLGHMRQDTELTGQCNATTCEMDFYPERYDPRDVASQELRFSNDYGLQDAGFAKLREVAASYTLPPGIAGRIGARSATLNVAARNLHTWTSFEGLDPEPIRLSQTYDVSNFSILPPLASFVTRVTVSF